MIKVRGFQVAPAEIEDGCLHGHPGRSRDCAVFGVPTGSTGKRVVAAVATGSGLTPR